MIRRLRIKIIALLMLVSVVLLSVAAGAFYSATAVGLRRDSESLLRRVVDSPPVATPFHGDASEVQLPYFVVSADDSGKVLDTEGGYFSLTDRQELQDAVTACLRSSKELDTLDGSSLRYYRTATGDGWRIAFVDITFEQSTLGNLLRNLLLICGIGLLLIFLLALLGAWLSVRPVAHAMEIQRQFLSDASHELKTPLTVILSNTELLLQQQAPVERQRRWVDHIQYEAKQMQALVLSLLELGHAESALPREAMEPVDLSRLLDEVVLSFDAVAFEARHTISTQSEPGLWVRGDPSQLHRLLSILLDNGVKYALPETAISVSLNRRRHYGVLTVSNPCEPLSPQQLSHLFERFYRADASRNSTGSFGLGLSIAKSIAACHRGTLRASCQDGNIYFTLELPLLRR